MSETAPEPAEPAQTPSDEPNRRWLLLRLRQILEIALDRVTNPKTPAPDRIKWSRVLISAGQACNSILRDVEIEALKQQIMELKALTMDRLKEDEDEQEVNSTRD